MLGEEPLFRKSLGIRDGEYNAGAFMIYDAKRHTGKLGIGVLIFGSCDEPTSTLGMPSVSKDAIVPTFRRRKCAAQVLHMFFGRTARSKCSINFFFFTCCGRKLHT